jgi:hypothetical protein
MIKDKIEKIPIKKDKKKLESIGLINQTRDPSYETEIILYKVNQNKSWNLISNQPIVKI